MSGKAVRAPAELRSSPRRRAVGPEPATQSQPSRRSSAGAPALQLAPLPPNSVRILGYSDYAIMFLPIARDEIQREMAAGITHTTPIHNARVRARFYATECLLRPGRAAGAAVGFFARRCGELEESFHIIDQEAAE